MKIRNCFVSNSSSSSFIMQVVDERSIEIKKNDIYKQWKELHDHVYINEDDIKTHDLYFKKYVNEYIDESHSFVILDIDNYAIDDITKVLQILNVKFSFYN